MSRRPGERRRRFAKGKPQRPGGFGAPPEEPTGPVQPPPRVHAPPVLRVHGTPRKGRWLWTCRAGFEAHLYEELAWSGAEPRMLGVAAVESDHPKTPPAFGRAGFKVVGAARAQDVRPDTVARELARAAGDRALHVQPWTLDTDEANRCSATAATFGELVAAALPGERRLATVEAARDRGAPLGQVCWLSPESIAWGLVSAREAVSLAPGGRQRMSRGAEAPSRAAAKLEEALELNGLEPGRGEVCVDLGAAPGGWTRRLIARGAKVIAVDPAKLAPELQTHRLVRHAQQSAFAFAPEEPVDWLFCDMAWRPLEVAQLLAKWARRAWAMHLVANIKLPMKDKNPILFRVRRTLEDAGWNQVRVRQLYHDRDEVTVLARRLG